MDRPEIMKIDDIRKGSPPAVTKMSHDDSIRHLNDAVAWARQLEKDNKYFVDKLCDGLNIPDGSDESGVLLAIQALNRAVAGRQATIEGLKILMEPKND